MRALRAVAALLALCGCANSLPDDPCAQGNCDVGRRDAVDAADALDAPIDQPATDVAVSDTALDAGFDAALDSPDGVADTLVVPEVAVDVSAAADSPAAPDTALDARDVAVVDAPDVAVVDAPDVAVVDAPDVAAVDVFDVTTLDVRDVATVDVRDAAPDVAPSGGCISGAVGTHVARFQWTGSTSGSRASVRYEANTLPDRARWRVTANSRSIGYTPVFTDPFLGEGGLELSGTVFIDVELSTAMLARISNVTIAVYGRSFNTTASGSFAWRTFSGMGATPSGLVANSAPYRWYRANATAAFVPGDGGVLLRITPGPPSGALVVNRVELCFDAR